MTRENIYYLKPKLGCTELVWIIERDSGAMNPNNQSHCIRHYPSDATGSGSHLT